MRFPAACFFSEISLCRWVGLGLSEDRSVSPDPNAKHDQAERDQPTVNELTALVLEQLTQIDSVTARERASLIASSVGQSRRAYAVRSGGLAPPTSLTRCEEL
jgi:hypothetical protein